MRKWFEWLLFRIGLKILMRNFKYIDVYSIKDSIDAITFSVSEDYINEVKKIKD